MPNNFQDVEIEGLFQVQIQDNGFNGMVNALGLALKDLYDEPLPKELLDAIGHNTKTFAQGLVPIRSKKLHDSINYHINGGKSVEVYATADNMGYPYGASIEYGFHPKGGSIFVEPRPFLRPALEYATELTKMSMTEYAKEKILIYSNHQNAHYGHDIHRMGGPLERLSIGNRMVRGQYFKTTANRASVQKYMRDQYLHNKYSAGKIDRRTSEGKHKYRQYAPKNNTSFRKGAWKNTVWGYGSKGRRG